MVILLNALELLFQPWDYSYCLINQVLKLNIKNTQIIQKILSKGLVRKKLNNVLSCSEFSQNLGGIVQSIEIKCFTMKLSRATPCLIALTEEEYIHVKIGCLPSKMDLKLQSLLSRNHTSGQGYPVANVLESPVLPVMPVSEITLSPKVTVNIKHLRTFGLGCTPTQRQRIHKLYPLCQKPFPPDSLDFFRPIGKFAMDDKYLINLSSLIITL